MLRFKLLPQHKLLLCSLSLFITIMYWFIGIKVFYICVIGVYILVTWFFSRFAFEGWKRFANFLEEIRITSPDDVFANFKGTRVKRGDIFEGKEKLSIVLWAYHVPLSLVSYFIYRGVVALSSAIIGSVTSSIFAYISIIAVSIYMMILVRGFVLLWKNSQNAKYSVGCYFTRIYCLLPLGFVWYGVNVRHLLTSIIESF